MTIKKIPRSEKENEKFNRGVPTYCSLGRIQAGGSWRNNVWWKRNAKAEKQTDEEGEAKINCHVLTVTHTKCRASQCSSGWWGQCEGKHLKRVGKRCWFNVYLLVSHYPSWQWIKLLFPSDYVLPVTVNCINLLVFILTQQLSNPVFSSCPLEERVCVSCFVDIWLLAKHNWPHLWMALKILIKESLSALSLSEDLIHISEHRAFKWLEKR